MLYHLYSHGKKVPTMIALYLNRRVYGQNCTCLLLHVYVYVSTRNAKSLPGL